MPYTDIVRQALAHNITAFDTSPYYGPSEVLLGQALKATTPPPTREGYFLITKAGRIASDEFDYSPEWIRYSICRSLERLNTPYLDLVYTHDVEFVSQEEVLTAVKELRRFRDQGLIRYVGISGFPPDVLASTAEMILRETGEPLDAVLSYSHLCVQNDTLSNPDLLSRFKAAGIDCLLNGSMLSMGLLTTVGVDDGPQASWHPAPPALRKACHELASIAENHGQHLEGIAIKWALQTWAQKGAEFGTRNRPATEKPLTNGNVEGQKVELPSSIGVSVMGVTTADQLEETYQLWTDVVGVHDADAAEERDKIDQIVREEMWPSLGEWKNYSWESGGPSFVNQRKGKKGIIPQDEVAERWGLIKTQVA